MANDENLKPFKKGKGANRDPRINAKGRPKNFDAARELAQAIAHEKAQAGGQTVVVNGHSASIIEIILRRWATSNNFQQQRAFVEYAVGKVPDKLEQDGAIKILVEYAGRNRDDT